MAGKKKEINNVSQELLDFIKMSPSAFHAVANLKSMLLENGFTELNEEDKWDLKAGGRYFTTRNDSSVIAFKMPKNDFENFKVVSSHSDSPSFKVKENPEMLVDGSYLELNVEKYGGMLMAPWFDRPLSIAGRVMVKTKKGIASKLINFDRNLCMIPNVAIHMNRQANEGYKYSAQKDMIPLLGDESTKDHFNDMVAKEAGVDEKEILSEDLFLYNRMDGTFWGANKEYISAPRLDDLQCAFSSMKAFISASDERSVNVCAVFDNEEVGSLTKQGADSTMFYDVLKRISHAAEKDEDDFLRAVAGSFMLSADNAHAVHPHHMDKADPTNRPHMNKGIVIKYNANQKYTTDAVSSAVFKEILTRAGVPYQIYVNNSDIAGGSTLGNLSNAHVSLNAVDIGLAQLAMHSPYETAGAKDTEYMIKGIEAFYGTHITKRGSEYLF
ncbi:MAG: M18 family aminopeptidase [Lachnospiraceae bacterium]|nr:M18 family aminopeptidase [Lachnospiraceae bacterium]